MGKDEEPDTDTRMIVVQCEGNCGEYDMSYMQLSTLSYFKE
jgi:hypothetical protein